jgi:hypothetical protein
MEELQAASEAVGLLLVLCSHETCLLHACVVPELFAMFCC